MFADLMAEMPGGDRYAEAARGWLDGVLDGVLPELRQGLRTRPSIRRISRHWDEGPEGEPGQVRGEIDVSMASGRSRMVVFTEDAWSTFLGSLGRSPVTVLLSIEVIGEDGYLSDNGPYIMVRRPEEEPGWVRLSFGVSDRFIWRARDLRGANIVRPGPGGGWAGSAQLQDRWAGVVRRQAARVGACAGMITSKGSGPMFLETVTYPDWVPEMVLQPPEYVQELAMLGARRDVLYRYSWVTIIPPELVRRLGGTASLTASGAFFEVSELPGGSLWLRATRTIEEFDDTRSAEVAAALAPVLVAATNL